MSILASMREKFKTAALGAAVLIGSLTIPAEEARADIIVELGDIWEFSTNVFVANDSPTEPTLGTFAPGTLLTANFVIDTAQTASSFDTSSAFNVYRSPSATTNINTFDLSNSSNRIFGDASTLLGNFVAENRQSGDTITISIRNGLSIEGFNGAAAPTNLSLSFFDPSGTAFDSAEDGLGAISALVNTPNLFEDNISIFITDDAGNNFGNLIRPQGQDSSIRSTLIQPAGPMTTAAVPETGTLWGAASILAGALLVMLRKKRAGDGDIEIKPKTLEA